MTGSSKRTKGFTLIELMIVVAIIGILALIAVPSLIAYRNKSRIASGIETANSIKGALAGCASITNTSAFPMTAELSDWASIRRLGNRHGAPLAETMDLQGYSAVIYHGVSSTGVLDNCDNNIPGSECSDICVIFNISGVPPDLTGVQLELRSSGLYRQTK